MKLFNKAKPEPVSEPSRLHVGCGQEAIAGWINIDNRALPGVDRVLDVRQGLPFENIEAIYAEHFLEHLSLEEGLDFLRGCRKALSPVGILRLSTPNLDWVYATHYRLDQKQPDQEGFIDCLRMNRAFHGWGHQFLYNRAMLKAVLRAAGFDEVTFHRYGESPHDALRGLERHETWEDTEALPHVLIAEASGHTRKPVPLPEKELAEFLEAIHIR